MRTRTKVLTALLGLSALVAALPGATFTLVEKSATLTLSQVAFCDGSVRTQLQPGTYDVKLTKADEGSFHATLLQGGVRKGETRAINAPGSDQILIGLLLPAVQKVREAAAPPAQPAGVAAPGTKIKN
jgi:hypothetical protein